MTSLTDDVMLIARRYVGLLAVRCHEELSMVSNVFFIYAVATHLQKFADWAAIQTVHHRKVIHDHDSACIQANVIIGANAENVCRIVWPIVGVLNGPEIGALSIWARSCLQLNPTQLTAKIVQLLYVLGSC